MSDDRNLFGMLDDISANQAELLNEITGVKNQVSDSDVRIAELEKEIQGLKRQSVQPKTVAPNTTQPKPTQNDILQTFLKRSKKSWRWFGTRLKFSKWKTLAIISLLILLIVGLATSIISTICFKMYSTFTFFENVWMVFGIFYLVYACKAQLTYEMNALASNSSYKYETDSLGMKFPIKEKRIFRIFKWLAIISAPCNIICIWGDLGKSNQILATVMEIAFLGAAIFAFLVNLNLYAQYSIIWIEGHNLTMKEKVVLVLPPGAKQLMPEEEFKKKMPFFYE